MAGPSQAFYAPDPIQSTQLIPGGNTPATGAQLFVYQVGSSTKQNSYTDASASTARTNPIVLDSGGNIPGNGEVWIASSAKFVLAPSNDTDPPVSPYWTRDAVPGINNVSALIASSAIGEWIIGSTATFVGVTAFSVVGNQTALYTLGRRVKATVTGGDRFGIVTSSVLSGASTAVGVMLDSSTLNGGLSALWYGLLSTPNGSVPWTNMTSSGVAVLGQFTVASSAIISSTVTATFFIPTTTGTTGFGLSTSGPAIYANSTRVFDITSTQANVTGAFVASSTNRANVASFSVSSFTVATTLTYLPPTGATRIEVYACAGGGGGGGTAGTGLAGSTTSFGGTTAIGGFGGGQFPGLGGSGGAGAVAFRARGMAGTKSTPHTSFTQFVGGTGAGSAFFGGGASASTAGTGTGISSLANTGGGGSGAGDTLGSTCAGGGSGECFALFISSPNTSYSYTVGAGGAGGTAGGGFAGGAGGSGLITIQEYYI